MDRKTFKTLFLVLLAVIIAMIIGIAVLHSNSRLMSAYSVSGKWQKLELVLQQIEENYVDTVDCASISEALIADALRELDPHSVYLPPKDLEEADEDLQGQFDGIGITFNVPADTAIVINTIVGGPSERAGLMSGDRIVRIDGDTVAGVGMPQDSMMARMKGPSGTKVLIEVKRGGVADLIPFEITRAKIPVNSIDCAFMVDDTTGYIRLSKFARTTYPEFMESAAKLKKAGMKRLIFDLRDNLGGFLDQALLLSNEFLDKGDLIVYMEGRKRPREDFYADGSGRYKDVKLDILVNESSASSSEIFAGAMQDNDRGKIFGRRSFGKGLVQEPIYFSDGSGIRLTVAKFYTPSGRSIQKPYKPGDDDEYRYDLIERYRHGEMVDADSIKVNDSLVFKTAAGRTVYGGGGIIPDVFVGIDTTEVNSFYIECTKKGLPVRFSTRMNDRYHDRLAGIDDFVSLNALLDEICSESRFLEYAESQGVKGSASEWEAMKGYIMTQVRALTGRYSALDDEAFYRIFLEIDQIYQAALADDSPVVPADDSPVIS